MCLPLVGRLWAGSRLRLWSCIPRVAGRRASPCARGGVRVAFQRSREPTSTQLGILIAELAGAGASITGPSWQLDASNPVHSEVRRLAAEDAKRRARDHASALGLEAGGLAWVSEPGLRQRSEGGQPERGLFGAVAAGGSVLAEEIIEVSPEEITAQASVEVGFTIQVVP
jgi:uncharacterized protein YggE